MNTTAIQLSRAKAVARSRSTRWALAHVEGRRLVTHPLFLLGLAFTVGQTLVAPQGIAHPSLLFALDGAVCVFLVAFLAASRERRDHTQETYLAQPTTARLRSEAALLSLGYAAVAAAGVAVALALVGRTPGPLPSEGGLAALRPLLLVDFALHFVLVGTLGVLVGTWTHHVHAAIITALVLFVSPLTLYSKLTFELTAGNVVNAVLTRSPNSIPYIVAAAGLTALAAAGTLARHDRRPRVVLLALVGVGALAGPVAMAVAAGLAVMVHLWPQSLDAPR